MRHSMQRSHNSKNICFFRCIKPIKLRGQVKASGPVPGSGFISEWYLWSHTVIPLERGLSVGSGAAGKHWTSIWRHTNTNAQYSVDLKDAVKSQVI